MTRNGHRKRSVGAAVVAIGLLAISGAGYRVLAGYLARPNESAPLPQGALNRLPLHIGDWVGKDVPMSEEIAKATDTDARVNRLYVRTGGSQSAMLYVAYGVRGRDLMPHRPEVCYPEAGWTLGGSSPEKIPLPNGSSLECRLYEFRRGGLSTQVITVLNYYVVDGQYSPDVSLLRSKAWRGSGGIRYMAQVQVTCSGSGNRASDATVSGVRELARNSAGHIRALFPDASAEPASGGR
jgi:hypothetical protein